MNYEFKGTPGPWRILTKEDNPMVQEEGYDSYNGVRDSRLGFLDSEEAIGFCITGCMRLADAHLIAAAPCLLEAAIDVLTHAVNNSGYLASESELVVFNRLKSAVEKALNQQP